MPSFRHILACALLGPLLGWSAPAPPAGAAAREGGPGASSGEQPAAPGKEASSRLSRAVAPGRPFPALEVPALRPGEAKPSTVRLGADLGKRPVVFVFFRMNHGISEEICLEVQRFVESETGGKVALYPLTELGDRYEPTELRERMELLGIRRPVLLDEERRVRDAMYVLDPPRIALVHSDGTLIFGDARSLEHPVFRELDVAGAIRVSAAGERPPPRDLFPHYPASDLVGDRFTDLSLPRYDTGRMVRIGDMVEPGKLLALYYWSLEDRFSLSAIPALSVVQRSFVPGRLNLLAVARDGTREEIREVWERHGLGFPVVRNAGRRFTDAYRIISTPTLILIRPDGIIDSVYTSGRINLFPVFSTKIKNLLISPPAPSSEGPSSG